MPKIICHMRHGHPFTIKCGAQVPGEPAELEVSDYQAECIKADCRVVVMSSEEFKAYGEKKAAEAKAREAQAERAAAKQAKLDGEKKPAKGRKSKAKAEAAPAE